MRVHLKGVHTVRKKLAGGRVAEYHYAWRGGPRLEDEPGSAAFVESFRAAHRAAKSLLRSDKILTALTDAYQDSQEFLRLAERTRADYAKIIRLIVAEFGTFPIKLLADRRCRADFLGWRDRLAKRSLRQADYAWTVLARILSWSVERGLIEVSPCTKGGRVYDGTRADKVWTPEQEAAFLGKASPSLSLAMLMALWTGQRQGDLLALTWFAYDGTFIRLQQSKTHVRVTIPVGAPLKAALDALRQDAPADGKILRNNAGEAWTPDGFRASWGKACRRAKIAGVTFHDLRGTAVSHLFLAGCTEGEIATLTGHTLHDVKSILDANYFSRDVALAMSGIAKLEALRGVGTGTQPVNQAVNQSLDVN